MSSVFRPLPAVAVSLLCAISLAGCRSPQSLCQEYVDSINAMFQRCDIPLEYTVQHPRTGEQGCQLVQQIPDPSPIVEECIPWADAIDDPAECAEVSPERLPSFCSARSFQIVE